MTFFIWYNTQAATYDFGTKQDFELVSQEFDLIDAMETGHLTMIQVARLTTKLNKNLSLAEAA